MKNQVKREKDILKTATSAVAEKFGINQEELKLSYKQGMEYFLRSNLQPKRKRLISKRTRLLIVLPSM